MWKLAQDSEYSQHHPNMPSCSPSRPHVLGMPVDAVDYDSALNICLEAAAQQYPLTVTAANTHLIALARHDASFASTIQAFDLVLPDGMPLIWSLRAYGFDLKDRVYGPYFMRHAMLMAPSPSRHFFFGGKSETLSALTTAIQKLRPEIEIAGTFSPPFREWSESDESEFAEKINASSPDFIWICLGGEKQERWIIKNRHRFPRGILVGVGDAFALLAGERPFAPMWMQKRGLTWLYRFTQEPGRLWKRYIKFNTLFLWYLLRDTLHRRT